MRRSLVPATTSTSCVSRFAGFALPVGQRGGRQVGEVLVQRASAGDVERLCAAADAEDRQPELQRLADDRVLERVEARLGRAELDVRPLVVGGRSEVGPTGKQQPVQPAEQRGNRGRCERGHHDRHAARGLDRARVRDPECHLSVRRLAVAAQCRELAGAELRSRDTDEWLHGLKDRRGEVKPISTFGQRSAGRDCP